MKKQKDEKILEGFKTITTAISYIFFMIVAGYGTWLFAVLMYKVSGSADTIAYLMFGGNIILFGVLFANYSEFMSKLK